MYITILQQKKQQHWKTLRCSGNRVNAAAWSAALAAAAAAMHIMLQQQVTTGATGSAEIKDPTWSELYGTHNTATLP
jgi:hypothetical protein